MRIKVTIFCNLSGHWGLTEKEMVGPGGALLLLLRTKTERV
jgi:hypothetical protein